MSKFRVRAAQSVIAALILVVAGTQPAFSQSTQHRQTDLQFVTRMNQEAAQMLTRANKLEERLRGVKGSAGDAETRAPERLRHKNRAVSEADLNRLRNELKGVKSEIRKEQERLKSKNFDKKENVKEQEKRMRKLDAKLRRVQTEIVALN